jgi:glucarate dehydratase
MLVSEFEGWWKQMKIKEVKVTPVTVPLEAPIRWSMGVETGTTRSIIEIRSDTGEVGIGETYGGSETASKITAFRHLLIGEDPFEFHKIYTKFMNYFRIPYEASFPPHAYAGIEMALLDLAGKELNRPVSSLLGGTLRRSIKFSGYLFYRYGGADGKGGENDAEGILEYAKELVDTYRYDTLKLKGGVLPPSEEIRTMRRLREEFGDDMNLRFDPNAAWSVSTSINSIRKMEDLDLEFVEDPTWGLNGMSLVRKDVRTPLATNMFVINFDQIPLSVHMRPVDLILGDIHYWGGPLQMRRVENLAEVFSLGVSMHSDRELGISTAAVLHYLASSHYIIQAADTHYQHQLDDILTESIEFKNGCARLPDGPGLGVEIDQKKIKKYNDYYRQHGDVDEFVDERRPGWIASLPLW